MIDRRFPLPAQPVNRWYYYCWPGCNHRVMSLHHHVLCLEHGNTMKEA
jgi:hypothetical protein